MIKKQGDIVLFAIVKKYLAALLILFFASNKITGQEIRLRAGVDNIVKKLRKEKIVHFGYAVGFSGIHETKNRYYKLYQKLKTRASNDELLQLTKDSNRCIVIYSFDILWQRDFVNLKDIFFQHQNDSAYFCTAGGCTGIMDRINFFMLRRLRPSANTERKSAMTKEEFDDYCTRFSKASSWFHCN